MMCDVHSNTTQPCEVCAGANGKLLIPPSQQRDDVYKKRKKKEKHAKTTEGAFAVELKCHEKT